MKGNEYQCFVYHDGSLLYATGTFTVYTLSEDDDLVMLKVEEHSEDATEKVVAVDTNTDTVIVKVRNWNDCSRLEISLSLVHWSMRFKNFLMKYNRLSLDELHCDVDRSVLTAYCESSSGRRCTRWRLSSRLWND